MASEVKGLLFPLRFDALGHFARSSGAAKLKGNIKTIILSALRERVMNPDFGSTGTKAVFRNMDAAFVVLVQDIVFTALHKHETRIRVTQVAVEPQPEEGQAIITVQYTVIASGAFDSIDVVIGES